MRHFHIFSFVYIILITNNIHTNGQTRLQAYENYIKKYKDIAIQQQKEYKIPASITLAQGLLESAAGDSRLARIGNNHFGIKCHEGWTGGRMYHDDDAIGECFRTYKSAEDSYKDHSKFLAYRKYYVSLFDLDLYDYRGWANGLKACGYATDKDYGKKLIRIIETYELYKYDREQPSKRRTNAYAMDDDIYEIKIDEDRRDRYVITNSRRKIYETNGIHYILAKENDTYDIIAYDFNVRVKKLLKYNETTADHRLRKGDFVYLQTKKRYAPKGIYRHTVAAGESLYDISQKYGMKLKYLYKLNRLDENHIIKPGDVLKVRK